MKLPIPVNIVTGALGVGKTTAVQHILRNKPPLEKWALLVNEFGSLGIDAALIEASLSAGAAQGTSDAEADSPKPGATTNSAPTTTAGAPAASSGVVVRELAGGCLCCTLSGPLGVAIAQLVRQTKPDRLIIEPSGLGHPAGLLDTLYGEHLRSALDVRAVICLVDVRVAATADAAPDGIAVPSDVASASGVASETFQDQVNVADVLVGHKADLASLEERRRFLSWAEQLYPPKAQVLLASHGQIDMALLDLPRAPVFRPLFNPQAHASRRRAAQRQNRGTATPAAALPLPPRPLSSQPAAACPGGSAGGAFRVASAATSHQRPGAQAGQADAARGNEAVMVTAAGAPAAAIDAVGQAASALALSDGDQAGASQARGPHSFGKAAAVGADGDGDDEEDEDGTEDGPFGAPSHLPPQPQRQPALALIPGRPLRFPSHPPPSPCPSGWSSSPVETADSAATDEAVGVTGSGGVGARGVLTAEREGRQLRGRQGWEGTGQRPTEEAGDAEDEDVRRSGHVHGDSLEGRQQEAEGQQRQEGQQQEEEGQQREEGWPQQAAEGQEREEAPPGTMVLQPGRQVSCGWLFSAEDMFDRGRLVGVLEAVWPRAARLKGIFRVGKTSYVVPYLQPNGGVELRPISYRRESRLEVIVECAKPERSTQAGAAAAPTSRDGATLAPEECTAGVAGPQGISGRQVEPGTGRSEDLYGDGTTKVQGGRPRAERCLGDAVAAADWDAVEWALLASLR